MMNDTTHPATHPVGSLRQPPSPARTAAGGERKGAFGRVAAVSIALGLALCTPAMAQNRSAPGTPPRPVTGTVELSEDLFRLDSVGLSMKLPLDAKAEATRIGTKMTAQITAGDLSYLINIQTPETSNPRTTIKEAADNTVSLIQGAFGKVDPRQVKVMETEAVLLERQSDLRLKGGAAERIYVSVPALNNARVVKGYTIFKPSETQFVVFELIVGEADFAKARGIYETVVATAEFADPLALAAARGHAVLAGSALLGRLTIEDYESQLDGKERWFRIAKPAPGGSPSDAEEIGYRGVRFWKGKRGEIDPDKPMIRWNRTDQQEGYLARVRARLLQGPDVLDSEGIFFMSPDRREEAWAVVLTVRERTGRPKGVWRETGAREDDAMIVSVEETGKPGKTVRPHLEKQGYLAAVESYLLPQLLIRAGVPTEFGFYTYRTQSETVALRRDSVSRDPASGTWRITTLFREDLPAQEATYNERGELIRSETGTGQVVTPVELDQLLRLWSSKGLPTGPLTEPRRR